MKLASGTVIALIGAAVVVAFVLLYKPAQQQTPSQPVRQQPPPQPMHQDHETKPVHHHHETKPVPVPVHHHKPVQLPHVNPADQHSSFPSAPKKTYKLPELCFVQGSIGHLDAVGRVNWGWKVNVLPFKTMAYCAGAARYGSVVECHDSSVVW